MILTANVTKSRAGHYTVTLRDSNGKIVLQDKFDNIYTARAAVERERQAARQAAFERTSLANATNLA